MKHDFKPYNQYGVLLSDQSNKMAKFEFLLGTWNMEYRVPKSSFSKEDKGVGTGEFKKALNDKYVMFNYSAELSSGRSSAHAIFAWDEKTKSYKYWWFEDSGSFMTATCDFINDDTLHLNWHDSLLIQTFTKADPNRIVLRMEHPSSKGKYELILEVIFTRK